MPKNRTHDISCVDFHLKNLDKFGQCLEEAANAAFPKGSSRYKEIHVLLLSWEDDNLGVLTEVLELYDVFRHVYHYDVEDWGIPSDHSYKALRKQITAFLDEYEDKDSLLIVYYGGRTYFSRELRSLKIAKHASGALGPFLSSIFLSSLSYLFINVSRSHS